MKKFLIYILFSSICHSLFAARFDFTYNYVKFSCKTLDNDSVEITSWTRNARNVIVIPAFVTDKKGTTYPVSAIDVYSSGDNYSANGLIIEEGIKKIDSRCFHEFRNLNDTIVLPKTLEDIGSNAFSRVKNFMKMSIPTEKVKNQLVNSGIDPRKLPPVKETIKTDTIIITKDFYKVNVVSLTDKGIIANRDDWKDDYNGTRCALLRVSIATESPEFYSDGIPDDKEFTPQKINGYYKIWMAEDFAESIRIYSNSNAFETIDIKFSDVNPQIERLKSQTVYELILTLEKKESSEKKK